MDTDEQAQMRRHLADMNHAARLLGKDVQIKIRNAEEELRRASVQSGRNFQDSMANLRSDISDLSRTVDAELARFPGQVRDGAVAAGSAISSASLRAASATRDAFETAGTKAKVSTKNALASAAGVNRKPLRQWHAPANDAETESP
jgi:hypothetical protein